MNEQGFYKHNDGELFYAPNFVLNKDYELRAELKDTYTYPVDGWAWHESRAEAETYTVPVVAEVAVARYFSPYQLFALQRLEMALLQAGKPLGPQMSAAKTWLESVMLGWAVDPTSKPMSAYGEPSVSFEQASAEAVADLASPNPET